MKRFGRITALFMIVLLLCSSFAFAGAAAIVSPASNTIVYSDSLLVSVKVTEPKTVRIAVYEEKETSGESLVSANVTAFTEADLALIAAAKAPAVQTTTAASILSDGSAVKTYSSVAMGDAVTYTCDSTLGFYTKQISEVKPGLYRVQVETVNPDGTASEAVQSMVAVKVKPVEVKSAIFPAPQTGALRFLQTFIRNMFR